MGFVQQTINYIRADGTKRLAKVGVFTVAVTVVSYWVSFQDRIATRQESAWTTLRAAIIWTQGDYQRWGNVGQIAAIETLTRHCGAWWQKTFLQPIFEIVFPDCVNLNSLSLQRMELGTLRGVSVNFAQSNFACANLALANLSKANLDGADFRGAFLGGTDLRGSTLRSEPTFYLTNVSWVQFDAATIIDPDILKCACVSENKGDDGKTYRQIQPNLPPKLSEILNKISICPSQRNTCDPEIQRAWKCID